MAKHNGGEGSVTFTIPPVDPETEGTPIVLCVSSIDSIDIPKGWAPSTTLCDYNPTLKATNPKREMTTIGLRFSLTAFSEDQLTEAQEAEILDTTNTGPIILKRHGTKGFYMALATVEVSYKPGGVEGLQTFTINGESYGAWNRGLTETP